MFKTQFCGEQCKAGVKWYDFSLLHSSYRMMGFALATLLANSLEHLEKGE